MDGNITINIVEPGTPPSPTPDPVVPNTGLFTSGTSSPEATIIAAISAVLILTIVAFVITSLLYRKQKKSGKVTKLVHLVDSTKAVLKSNKRITTAVILLAILTSTGTFIALAKNAVNASESDEQSQTEGTNDSSLTVDVSSEELTIEVADAPVFAILPVEVTVEEATEAGYTLTAYANSTDLVSTTDSSKAIPMVAADEDELVALANNTYGLALEEKPTTKDEAVYTSLSIDPEEPTILKSMPEYTPTEENDTTTIYYGFYITPDIPYGTYTNDSEVYYNATINTTPVTFDGKGLYFNDDPEQTTNEVEYIAVPEEGKEYNINQIVSGEYKKPSQDLPYKFLGWSTDKNATVPTYETEEKIAEFLPISPNTPITLYAVWQHATELSFDGNGADGGEAISTRTIAAGNTITLPANTFTCEGYTFIGWNTESDGGGNSYADKAEYTAPAISQNITLYAQWEEDALYMQDVATWGSTLQQGDEITVVDSRDGKGYTVARLADGNIWMTQNLDHNIGDVDGGMYTSADTDLPSNATWTPNDSEYTYTTDDTTWNGSATAPESYDPGELYWNGELNENWDGTLDTMTTESGDSHYHIGNYYNWTAAVAMNDSSSYTTDQQDVNQSICPAGWRLPTYSGDKSYENLVSAQSLSAGTSGNIQSAPTYFVYGGGWYASSYNVGSVGYYRSSVVRRSYSAYLLSFYVNDDLNPQNNDGRGYGFSLRCVAR